MSERTDRLPGLAGRFAARRAASTLAACVAIWATALVTSSVAGEARAAGEGERHVVVVSIDGLAGYLLDDPKAPLATIRRLARDGATAEGGMRVSNPSVTWPNHTTLMTGVRPEKHGVLANGVLVRSGPDVPVVVDAKRDQRDLVRVATLFDAARAGGLRTAEINWPCTRGAASLDDSFPDVPEAVAHMTPRLRDELIAAGLLADATDKSFTSGSVVGRDYVWTEAACHVIRKRRPHLMMIHLLNVDATHHAFGPRTPAGYTANAYADMCLGRIVAALDDAGIRDRTTLLVVSDHGFATTPQAVRPNAVLRREGLLKAGPGGKVVEAQAHLIPEGGIGLIYFTDRSASERLTKRVSDLFAGQTGVREVLRPEQFAAYGLPHPREYSQAPDLVLAAEDGYGVSGSADGETLVCTQLEGRVSLGSHGFLSTLPKMNATCVLSGRGVRRGATLRGVENIDVAPTIARLLGLKAFACDGRALEEALEETLEAALEAPPERR